MTRLDGPIVVGVDSAAPAAPNVAAAIEFATLEATRRHVGLHLVAGYERHPAWISGEPAAGAYRASRDIAHRRLDRALSRTAAGHPDLAITAAISAGSAAQVLVEASVNASVVVVCADARVHYGGLQAGLVSVQVAAHADAPVIVVPTPHGRPAAAGHSLVVVGIDGSPADVDAVAFAFEEADARGAGLHAVFAWDLPTGHTTAARPDDDTDRLRVAADHMLRNATAAWQDKYSGTPVSWDARRSSSPVRALSDAGSIADLIVVGRRGQGGFDSLVLGSVSDGLARYSRTNVAVVPSLDRAARTPALHAAND